MSNYGDPGPGHRNALNAVGEARQKALEVVSKTRQVGPPPHDPNLAPASDEPALATVATQAVVDYLLQLRPYRNHSAVWDVSFGTVRLPERVAGESPTQCMGKPQMTPPLYICQDPTFTIENVSDFVQAANTTVRYSSKTREQPGEAARQPGAGSAFHHHSRPSTDQSVCDRWTVDTKQYGKLIFSERRHVEAFLNGELSQSEVLSLAEVATDDEDDEDAKRARRGDPRVSSVPGDTSGPDHQVKSFKLVFSADELQTFLAHGDDIAAELDVLADLEAPDFTTGPGGAV